jgi:hypothetical protein
MVGAAGSIEVSNESREYLARAPLLLTQLFDVALLGHRYDPAALLFFHLVQCST